ncbi:MAG: hypothetical protein J6Y72_06585 [Bacteroidales bacterium]|nr:hypothetical protein [Bacteroidales bacterium]
MEHLFKQAMEDFPAFKKMVYVIWALIPIGGIFLFWNDLFAERNAKFVPYSGEVKRFYTEPYMRAGKYYQRIKLKNGKDITANAFSSTIAGQKTMLIDYIAVGDSIVRNTFDTIYVYRKGADTYVFTHNKGDFK